MGYRQCMDNKCWQDKVRLTISKVREFEDVEFRNGVFWGMWASDLRNSWSAPHYLFKARRILYVLPGLTFRRLMSTTVDVPHR